MIKEKNSKITSANAENHFIKNHVWFKEKNSYKTRNKKKLSKCGKAQFKNLPQQMLLVLQQVHPFRSLEQPKEACYLSCVLKAIITSIYHCPGTPGCQNYKRKISKYKDFLKSSFADDDLQISERDVQKKYWNKQEHLAGYWSTPIQQQQSFRRWSCKNDRFYKGNTTIRYLEINLTKYVQGLYR